MNPAGIDTSALLTMLGLIAAVWSIVRVLGLLR